MENEFLHNWLYSVVPLFPEIIPQSVTQAYTLHIPGGIFLTGYCRACNNAFTVNLPIGEGGNLTIENLGIPKTGCVGPKGA